MRSAFRSLRGVLPAALLVSVVSSSWGRSENIKIQGPREPVEILRDRWGISHIYARNERDLFFAQGFVAARDRLFQLEMWRRQATGTKAEILGKRALEGDVGARLLRYRGDLSQELNRYHPRGEEIIKSFVAGVNAYIAQAVKDPNSLPVEFKALGILPGRWTPEVVVSRHNGLFRNVTSETKTAKLVRAIGEARARELLNLRPGRPRLDIDPALRGEPFDEGILGPYSASRTGFTFLPGDVEPAYRRKSASPVRDDSKKPGADGGDGSTEGSNNWVISGDHTFSGLPILANDPHRAIQLPSLRYWVHLVAPGWNVIGAGEPALPGVSVGHNEHGAWGFTIFPIDQEDLYVYETHPSDPLRYKYRDGWETMRVEKERVLIKGGEPAEVAMKFTRHGPVLSEDPARNRAYALRAAWLEAGAAPYLAGLRMNQASNLAEFRESCRYFMTPSENLVWVDRAGHIGWQAVGAAPLRRGWDGLVPVPGDGRYEWEGYLSVLELPHVSDPPRGWFATANQENLPRGFPHAVGFQWTDPFRFARIEEVLDAKPRFNVTDMMRLQHDELSIPARSLTHLLKGVKSRNEATDRRIKRLAGWDFVLDRDSEEAAIYVAWERVLKAELRSLLIPSDADSSLRSLPVSTDLLIRLLSAPDGRFGTDPIAARDAFLLDALEKATATLERKLGADRRYGQEKFKHAKIEHPLGPAVSDELRARLDVGPLPRGGYSHTVNSTSDEDNQATGASFRIIADSADWDRSVGTNTPGQSGDPDSPHYRDLFPLWANGKYFPVLFSRDKVESVTENRTVLMPDGSR